MENYLYRIREKWEKKEVAIGTHMHFKEAAITEIIGDMGFDFVWIDMEHTGMDTTIVQNHLIACRATGMASFVRVPWNDPILVKPILEMNPSAVIFPQVKSADEAKAAVMACKYPPLGIRGFGPKRASGYGIMDVNEYVDKADSSFLIIIQIEHVEAVKNLDDILKVSGIDSIVIGPNDLSGSLGVLGNTKHPEVKRLIKTIAEKVNKYKIPFGNSIRYDEQEVQFNIDLGVSWLSVGTVEGYVIEGGKKVLGFSKKLLKNK
jgi:2-keto-3-deoxy-L-rhamnonate aldolase RhmA